MRALLLSEFALFLTLYGGCGSGLFVCCLSSWVVLASAVFVLACGS